MAKPILPDSDFIQMFEELGPARMSVKTGMTVRGIYNRRVTIEKNIGRQLTVPDGPRVTRTTRSNVAHAARLNYDLKDGIVLVGSDAHYWPGAASTAHRAFVHFVKELKPKIVIKNGDALDGARISRFSPIGWENRPPLIDEIEACKLRLDEIVKAAKNAKLAWPLGNHDGRFETRLATVAPEYAKIHGVHLQDHFPEWTPCWAVWINDDVVIKHRYRNGIHAVYNNTIAAGTNMVTGHLHSLKVTPFSDYNGTRYGVDCGTMAPVYGAQFTDYTEDNPRNWRSGFAVLTFHKGKLLWPEVVHVLDEENGVVEFRGKTYEV